MYNPNMPAPMPGQMQITSMPQSGGMTFQPPGQRVGVPQGGGISPGGFPAYPGGGFGGMAPPMGGGFGGQRPPMGGFTPPQMPPQFGGMVPGMNPGGITLGGFPANPPVPTPDNALGGLPIGVTQGQFQRPDGTMGNGFRMGPGMFDVRGFMDAIRTWIASRPQRQGYEGDFQTAQQDWRADRPDFWSYMNQQQAQAAGVPPMAAPTVI